ncbi:conserved Plasmodium protein, unknown function [Plasmodium vivax]|uniref:Uncharacterized protein n=6 Tax=Plasmodium vivax TaxID=5855 RepID=A5KB82_PLAVS|nr:hypothetical protein, conserved [Plasmodium vivax]KMZ80726.1 hypothetical protein PVIIG_03093 [Plasmodium vivax India VII]KMZ86803.1 hypothetical protein PVBG_04461 [Plasmodium vivax Brazil I]KMZ93630.1 hypothetical protein PVMG_01076 [Plasmodium vivax Mauritania I]KMZ99871.1 hypothetical protein PVNG_05901 [Plasmodium vivax North Korean]EDL43360.1 hypothetical protein, conserved [Plasmodium vivax]|eukprot:XP_001613087.1 hypothetical protein [Plasmodium vivax Sal-1]
MMYTCTGHLIRNHLAKSVRAFKGEGPFAQKNLWNVWAQKYSSGAYPQLGGSYLGGVPGGRGSTSNVIRSGHTSLLTPPRRALTSCSAPRWGKQTSDESFFEGEHLNRKLGGYGYPMMFIVTYDRPSWQPFWENEYEVIPRDEFGVPASIPPEVSTQIKHTYYVPPQFYTFLKKLGDDTEELKPYMTKLIRGEFTYDDYQEMFYKFAKPLKIFRNKIALPYRTAEEMAREEEMKWESAWYTYRQKMLAEYNVTMCLREFILYMTVGLYFAYLWLDALRQYRLDMKLFYLEAPEHKINWVKPRGDLV